MTLPVSAMISVEEARERILAFFRRLEPVQVPLLEALGQVLAENVIAPFDIPPLDNTAMDGYAVRAADTSGASEGGQWPDTEVYGSPDELSGSPDDSRRLCTNVGIPFRGFESSRVRPRACTLDIST